MKGFRVVSITKTGQEAIQQAWLEEAKIPAKDKKEADKVFKRRYSDGVYTAEYVISARVLLKLLELPKYDVHKMDFQKRVNAFLNNVHEAMLKNGARDEIDYYVEEY